jgi:uncharacterized protein YutE (UPF0331/DUF86 family)
LSELRDLPAGTREDFLAAGIRAARSRCCVTPSRAFDCARHLLAKAHGEGALEYKAVARSARERGLVFAADRAEKFERMAGFRNRLIHHYEDVTFEELRVVVRDHLDDIEAIGAELERAATRLASA